jgi:hypothetical protein
MKMRRHPYTQHTPKRTKLHASHAGLMSAEKPNGHYNRLKKKQVQCSHWTNSTCLRVTLPPIYCIFVEKIHFLKWKISNNLVTWYPDYVKWHGSIHLQLS